MMFCASAGSRPDTNRLDLDALFLHRLLDAAATRHREAGFGNFARIEDDVAFLQAELLDHAIAELIARGEFVHADIGLAAIALGAFEIVIVEADDDDARLDGGADAGIESIRAGDRNGDAVDAADGGALDQVVLAHRIVVGILHVEIDAELCRGILCAFDDGVKELDTRIEVDDHRRLDVGRQGGGCESHSCARRKHCGFQSGQFHLRILPLDVQSGSKDPMSRLAGSDQRSRQPRFSSSASVSGELPHPNQGSGRPKVT